MTFRGLYLDSGLGRYLQYISQGAFLMKERLLFKVLQEYSSEAFKDNQGDEGTPLVQSMWCGDLISAAQKMREMLVDMMQGDSDRHRELRSGLSF